jgi:hypothetical protein
MNDSASAEEHFCVLVIGDPGRLGFLSLQSMFSTHPVKICALVDSLGSFWIDKFEADTDAHICKHQIQPEHTWVLADSLSELTYESFGSPKFFRLMYLKWVILQECIKENSHGRYLIFSDLDVVWFQKLQNYLHDFDSSSAKFALQDDSTNARNYFCPGIMIWKKTIEAQISLNMIQDFHYNELTTNPFLPDDKAINKWLALDQNDKDLYVLPRHGFIIGHRIYKLLLGVSGYQFSRLIAFHANYSIGSAEKILKAKAVIKSLKFKPLRYLYLGNLLLRHFGRKWTGIRT